MADEKAKKDEVQPAFAFAYDVLAVTYTEVEDKSGQKVRKRQAESIATFNTQEEANSYSDFLFRTNPKEERTISVSRRAAKPDDAKAIDASFDRWKKQRSEAIKKAAEESAGV